MRRNWKTVLALAVGLAAGSLSVGQESPRAGAKRPAFEVASLRLSAPGDRSFAISPAGALQYSARNVSLNFLIEAAYGVADYQVVGEPGWAYSILYDLVAKPEGDVALTYKQLEPLMQQLLEERLHLVVHHETRNLKGFALVAAKGGAKLTPSAETAPNANILRDGIRAKGTSMKVLAELLAIAQRQPVVDRTGIAGNYEIKLSYAPMGSTDSALPSVFTAVQEQLGLRMEPQMVPVEMLVIDRVEKEPVAN